MFSKKALPLFLSDAHVFAHGTYLIRVWNEALTKDLQQAFLRAMDPRPSLGKFRRRNNTLCKKRSDCCWRLDAFPKQTFHTTKST